MKILVDSAIWSLALRRNRPDIVVIRELGELVREGRVVIIGAIRQEVLSGTRTEAQYKGVRDALRAFDDLPLSYLDYEEAARCFNRCRQKGIQGSNTDFLLCATALNHDLVLYTTDHDFERYADLLGVHLHVGRQAST